MLKSKKINLNGLELSGDEPISPRTQGFLDKHNMIVRQLDGWVEVTENFSLKKSEVNDFLSSKKLQEEELISAESDKKNEIEYCGFKRGFLN